MSEIDTNKLFQPLPTYKRFVNLSNKQFGFLNVLGYAGIQNRLSYWVCKCRCGKIKSIRSVNLIRGSVVSCGCYMKQKVGKQFTKHGKSLTKEYKIYHSAKSRCQNPNDKSFFKYGGRGIKFNFNSFEDFLTEVGKRPSEKYSLDRINNNGHYEKGNVQWKTSKEQSRNTRRNHFVTYKGKTKSISEWAEKLGLSKNTLNWRIRHKFCVNCIFKKEIGVRCQHIST